LAHNNPTSGRLPEDTPDHQQVVRGWEAACDIASRITMPDHTVVAGIARVRSNLLLGVGVSEDASIELVRLAETHRDSIVDVVETVQRRVKAEKRAKVLQWDTPHLLATAARACVLLGDEVAAGDIGSTWLRLADRDVQELPLEIPAGLGAIAWAESLLAQASPSGGQCALLPHGIPETWWGSPFEGHGLIADPYRTISFAVRWHGPRPAVLWEVSGAPGLLVTAGKADSQWHTTDASGEALLAAPVSANV
jgi:predicted nucleic acid-binding protein